MDPIEINYVQPFTDPDSTYVQIATFNAITGLMDGGKYAPKKYKFDVVPPEFTPSLDVLKAQISADGFDSGAPSNYITGVSLKSGTLTVANVSPPGFDASTVQYVCYQQGPVPDYAPSLIGKTYNFNGANYGSLIISVPVDDGPIFIAGSTPELGMWNGFYPIPFYLTYGRGGVFWQLMIPVIVGSTFEFKLLKGKNNWESGGNRTFTATQPSNSINLGYNN
jgi:hypothetical protein